MRTYPPTCGQYQTRQKVVSFDGYLQFQNDDGSPTDPIPIPFHVPYTQKTTPELIFPGPVVDQQIDFQTITIVKLLAIQVVESASDATVTLNDGTPLPLKGRRPPMPTSDPPDPPDFSPGVILYCNVNGGLTSVKFNSNYQLKVRVYIFGD